MKSSISKILRPWLTIGWSKRFRMRIRYWLASIFHELKTFRSLMFFFGYRPIFCSGLAIAFWWKLFGCSFGLWQTWPVLAALFLNAQRRSVFLLWLVLNKKSEQNLFWSVCFLRPSPKLLWPKDFKNGSTLWEEHNSCLFKPQYEGRVYDWRRKTIDRDRRSSSGQTAHPVSQEKVIKSK